MQEIWIHSSYVFHYGMLIYIVDLHYLSEIKVILFKCDWWDIISIGKGIKNDKYDGFTCLNFAQAICIDEQFVLEFQAKQVFYVQNSNDTN